MFLDAYVGLVAQEVGLERAVSLMTKTCENMGVMQGQMTKTQARRPIPSPGLRHQLRRLLPREFEQAASSLQPVLPLAAAVAVPAPGRHFEARDLDPGVEIAGDHAV